MVTTARIKIVLSLCLLLTSSCICTKPIPLQDSDIPIVMAVGEYKSADGDKFVVTEDRPKFAVSEGYILESSRGGEWYNDIPKEVIFFIAGGVALLWIGYKIRGQR